MKSPWRFDLAGLSTRRVALDDVEVTNMLVATAFRGRGVGSLLLEHVEAQARSRWTGIVLNNSGLWHHPARRRPQEFYLKNGYEKIWETPDTVVFAKSLAE